MKSKSVTVTYWIVTIIFASMMLLDGFAGLLRAPGTTEALAQLDYPAYLATILGTAKILGALAVLQTGFRTPKEWAYAGFAFVFIGAAASHAFVGSGIGFILLPFAVLGVMLVSYFFWRKIESEKL